MKTDYDSLFVANPEHSLFFCFSGSWEVRNGAAISLGLPSNWVGRIPLLGPPESTVGGGRDSYCLRSPSVRPA